jgi:nitrite reductase/ring-hydroxylating ferredoxin subunit
MSKTIGELSALEGAEAIKTRAPVGAGGAETECFIVRTASGVAAYVNVCPHMGARLDAGTGKFLDAAGQQIMCRFHRALFDVETGTCIGGPCLGRQLQRIDVVVVGNSIELAET